MLAAIVKAADDKVWSHAGMLLEQMTTALDREGHAVEEAREPTTSSPGSGPCSETSAKPHTSSPPMRTAGRSRRVAAAEEHLSVARLEDALEALGAADGAMERLRRRI